MNRYSSMPDAERQGLQNAVTKALLAALAITGPITAYVLFYGQILPFVLVVLIGCATAIGGVFGRRGYGLGQMIAHQAALATGAIALALLLPGPFNAGSALALAAALYGFSLARTHAERAVILPSLVALGLGFAGGVATDGTTLAMAIVAACLAVIIGLAVLRAVMAEQTRAATSPELARTVETLVGAIVYFGRDGHPEFISSSATDLLGARRFELSGNGLFERVHLLDRPAYAKAISDVAASNRPQSLEIRMRRDGGATEQTNYIWVELSLGRDSENSSKNGRTMVIGVFRDISARKQSEADLLQARADAEEASDAKSRFLATIGHELRTPLNAIVGFSDMMTEGIGGELSTTHRDYAGHISQSGHHLLGVVNMLLDMSKIDAGKFEIQAEWFAPMGLVEPCLQMVEQLGREHNVHVEARVDPRLPQLVGDERACRQVVINLLSNAIKFSHEEGTVTLTMKRQGKMLAIAVTDQGIGMHADTVRRIGEPFLQAQDGLSRQYEGTGLGLSIVKGLVSLHDGRLSVASEPGAGTCVTVLLPLDGPGGKRSQGTVEHLYPRTRETDEQKWQDDERKSAAQ